VLMSSLTRSEVGFREPGNFWAGPRPADLIHLGAKFAPCMRKDLHLYREIKKQRTLEKDTACCIRNDQAGCLQLSKEQCSTPWSSNAEIFDPFGVWGQRR
ncbi:unnamed protein product, partial [Cyprideis torosa]